MTTPSLVSAGSVGSAVGSYTPSFGQSTTAGNFLVAWANSDNPNASEATPIDISGVTGWSEVEWCGAGYNWSALWYKLDCGSDETAPTFSDVLDEYTITAGVAEFSGVATSSAADQCGRANTADPCYATAADTAGGDLILSLSTWNGPNSGPTLGQTVYGSAGTGGGALSSTLVQGDSGGAGPLFYYLTYSIGPSGTPGSYANEVTVSISENEGYVSSLITSFLAAS